MTKNTENGKDVWVWRTDLLGSRKYWEEWFTGMTQAFISLEIPKCLIIGKDTTLDKDLEIARMQGKFKVQIMDNVSHAIQEDDPTAVGRVFKDYL